MSDVERRELARRAGDGDLGAAEKLVVLLRREQAYVVLSPDTVAADLKEGQIQEIVKAKKLTGGPGRFLRFIKNYSKSCECARHYQCSCPRPKLTDFEIRNVYGVGDFTVEIVKAVVRAAGIEPRGEA